MTTASDADIPLHLTGNNAPVAEEVTVERAGVAGQIPPELAGMFVRNGPNPRTGWSPHYFAGALATPMTAHPKVCPVTGELLFFGTQLRPPYLTYYRASAAGNILQEQVVEIPCATMMHDFAITEHHVVFMDLPVVFDLAAPGGPGWRWDDAHRARFGVMARTGGPVRWFEVAPCYVWHTLNAFETNGILTLVGTRVPSLWRGGSADISGGSPRLHRWRLNLTRGTVTEEQIDDEAVEYPRVADTVIGRAHRFGYLTSFSLDAHPSHSAIHRYDLTRGDTRHTHQLPDNHTCGEAVFVPRHPASDENDGFLLTFAHDRARGTSYLLILDATDLAAAPLAEVHLPVRVPNGFHGTWIPTSVLR